MLDIETLSTHTNAVVRSIAFVPFIDKGVVFDIRPLVITFEMQEQLDKGAHLEANTILWWIGQNQPARERMVNAVEIPVENALKMISDYISEAYELHKEVRIWGNGVGFDNTIVKALFARHDVSLPWDRHADMDYRTMKSRYTGILPERDNKKYPPHDPIADCEYQIECLREINRHPELIKPL